MLGIMEKRISRPKFVDLYSEFARSVTCVDTDPGDSIPHVTLSCGHGVYLCGETLTEAQARSHESRLCSQCLNEYCVKLQQAS